MTSENSSSSIKQVKLNGLYLYKEGMSTWFDAEKGLAIPVTVLKYEPHYITQLKTKDKEGYFAAQVSVGLKSLKHASLPLKGHLKSSGVAKSVKTIKEITLQGSEDLTVGEQVSIDSFQPGDLVKVIGESKGKGFAGSVKRYGFAGGPASHGSKFHRQPGSSGNRTWPGRVMPGKKFPGHMGAKTTHVKNLQIVKVDHENNVVLIKGAIPGGRNSLVGIFRS